MAILNVEAQFWASGGGFFVLGWRLTQGEIYAGDFSVAL